MEPWQRFSTNCRQAVITAWNDAAQARVPLIGMEHLLHAMTEQREGGAAEAFLEHKVDVGLLAAEVRALLPETQPDAEPPEELAFTPEAQRALNVAYAQSRRREDGHVGTEHLLSAIVSESRGALRELLQRHGLGPEAPSQP